MPPTWHAFLFFEYNDTSHFFRPVIACGSVLFLRFELPDERSELRGDGAREGVVANGCMQVRRATEDFARYVYLPRLADPAVLISAIRDGSFAYADDFDEKAGRYRGLRHGRLASLPPDAPTGLLVQPEIAKQQLELETKPPTDSTKEKTHAPEEKRPPPPRTTKTQTLPWQRHARSDPGRPRRRPHC